MSNARQVMQIALDALEYVVDQGGGPVCEHQAGGAVCFCKENEAINALRKELAAHPQATEPISEYCEHGILWDTVCRSCDELPAAAMPVGELTESELMKCIAQAGCFGTVELSYESGPYDIDRPTLNATKLARAILAAASTQPVREPLRGGSVAFAQYLEECEACAIEPDVGGAFNAGWIAAHGIK